jgi:formate dehydrogenase iron-sulfur subunit
VDDLDELLAAGFIQDSLTEAKKHRLCLGLTQSIPYLKNQQRLNFSRLGLYEPLDLAAYEKHEGFVGLRKALAMTPQKIVDEVKTSGLRGRGGAAFPTGIKWQTALDAESDQKYIVCNADEGDSGTFSDRLLMEGDPYNLIEGMIIAGLAVGATQGYIYLRSEYPDAHQTLNAAIEQCYQKNYLGANILASGQKFELEVRLAAGAYICGEETSLLESLEGKRGQVRSKPPLPAIEGLFAKPTIVNNVISLGTVPVILAKGGDYYRDFGMGKSRGTLPFQLAGNIKQSGLVEVAFGMTLREILYDFGGGSASGRPIKAVQIGGPLGAYIHPDQFDTPLDYESFMAIGGMLGHGGIVVFDDTANLGDMARFAMEFCAIESCGKCTPCRIGSTRAVEVIDKIRQGEQAEENTELLEELCETMIDGSLCALGGMAPFPVKSILEHFPDDMKAQ